jgi:hypothetical protein
MEACLRQLLVLKALLNTFADSTSLKVNYSKSILPINITEDKLQHLARTFGCIAGTFPFTYLGLLVGTARPRIEHFDGLVLRAERRLFSTGIFLTQAGKLELVRSFLSSLPTYFMSTIKIPISIHKQIDKYRRHGLWNDFDIN